jgi:chorismate synthase
MGGFSSEKLGSEIARGFVSIAALTGLTIFELGVGWEKALMVGWTSEGFFATGL